MHSDIRGHLKTRFRLSRILFLQLSGLTLGYFYTREELEVKSHELCNIPVYAQIDSKHLSLACLWSIWLALVRTVMRLILIQDSASLALLRTVSILA